MKISKILETYHSLFLQIVEDLRSRPKKMAEQLGLTGRGRSPSTIWDHLDNMYKKKISRSPILIMNPCEGSQSTVYFSRKTTRKGLRSTFLNLYRDERIDYVLFLSGTSDFFITTRERNLDLSGYDLEIVEKSLLYRPIFTIPYGWKLSVNEALDSLANLNFSEGMISREVADLLEWEEVDWRIYEAVTYVVTVAEYGEVEMSVWKDGNGAVVAREWKTGDDIVLGGYYQCGDHWRCGAQHNSVMYLFQ